MKLRTLISFVHRPFLNSPFTSVDGLCSGSMIKVDITSSVGISFGGKLRAHGQSLVCLACFGSGFPQDQRQDDRQHDSVKQWLERLLIVRKLAVAASACLGQP